MLDSGLLLSGLFRCSSASEFDSCHRSGAALRVTTVPHLSFRGKQALEDAHSPFEEELLGKPLVSWLTGYLVDRLAGYLAAWLTCEFVTSFVRSSVRSLARAFVCWFIPCLCARVSLFDSFVRLSACLCARVGTCVDLYAS